MLSPWLCQKKMMKVGAFRVWLGSAVTQESLRKTLGGVVSEQSGDGRAFPRHSCGFLLAIVLPTVV